MVLPTLPKLLELMPIRLFNKPVLCYNGQILCPTSMAEPEKQKPKPKLQDGQDTVPDDVSSNPDLQSLKLQTDIAAEHQKIKQDIDTHLRSFLDAAKGLSEEKKGELYKKAQSTSVLELQLGHKWLEAKPEEKYATLSALYLTYESSNLKESFRVSDTLDQDPKVKMSVGAAHLLPPNVTRVRIIDTKGMARVGSREVRNGKVGYFDAKGYIPIFGGYQIDPLEILDPNSDDASKRFDAEQKFAEKKFVEYEEAKKRDMEDDLPDTLDAMTEATQEDLEKKGFAPPQVEIILKGKSAYEKASQIFAYNSLKIDSDSSLQGARGFYSLHVEDLGWKEGVSVDQMDTEHNSAIQFLKVLQNGGTIEGFQIRGGYLLNFSQLPELLHLVKTSGSLRSVLEAVKAEDVAKGEDDREIDSARIIEYIFERGVNVMNGVELKKLIRENPSMQHLVDPQWGIEAYMRDSWIKRGSGIRGLHPPTDADLNAGRDQQSVGYKCCAFVVSNYLDLPAQGFGNELSASRLAMRLIKGGGKVLPHLSESERGDVIVMKGTRKDSPSDQITHVLLTRDVCRMPDGNRLIIVQDDSEDLGVKFVVDSPADRKRITKMVSDIKVRLSTMSPSEIEDMVKQYGFSESDVRKITSALVYRQKFPETIRVASTGSEYFGTHLYAIVRPNYSKDSLSEGESSPDYGETKKARLNDHA